jgi:hypothetical protein
MTTDQHLMHVQNLKTSVETGAYDVDAAAVAEAMIRHAADLRAALRQALDLRQSRCS